MGSFCADMEYGIGTTAAGIVALRLMYVPPPDQVIWKAAASYYARADLHRVGDGFASIEWIWDTISISRLSKILEFLGTADSVALYVQSDKRDGTYPNPAAAFRVFSAIMWKPILSGQEGTPLARSPYVMQTVKITFINTIELAGYL